MVTRAFSSQPATLPLNKIQSASVRGPAEPDARKGGPRSKMGLLIVLLCSKSKGGVGWLVVDDEPESVSSTVMEPGGCW